MSENEILSLSESNCNNDIISVPTTEFRVYPQIHVELWQL